MGYKSERSKKAHELKRKLEAELLDYPPDPKTGKPRKLPGVKPTPRQKKFLKVTTKAVSEGLEPVKAMKLGMAAVYPQQTIERTTTALGLQKLIRAFEEKGLKPETDADRMAKGVNADDKQVAIRYEQLYYRLKYPEAFRNNVNIDNRSINLLEGKTDAELMELLGESKK